VKTAVHGADPNWGRVVMAVGKCSDDTDIRPAEVRVSFGAVEAYPAPADDAVLARLAEVLQADEVEITVGLATGEASARVWGCDLADGYVRINADYTT
jgi:glutamate N-acetyltransferase/amino-acid N-acetyltransferase